MSWLKAEAPRRTSVHPRDAGGVPRADVLVEGRRSTSPSLHGVLQPFADTRKTNNDMSVTPPVSHVEMWPYVASAAHVAVREPRRDGRSDLCTSVHDQQSVGTGGRR